MDQPNVKCATGFRWIICALLFFATTCNYMDRQVMSILAPQLKDVFHWNDAAYGFLVTGFQAAYAVGLLGFGYIIDRIGTKGGYTLSALLWSLAAAAHALTRTILGFSIARIGLGLFEAGNFPSAIKAVAEWFPRRERALATGIFNSGANIGAIAAPILVTALTLRFGWRAAFVGVGALGLLFVCLWWLLYSQPEHAKWLPQAELEHIRSDAESEPMQERLTWPALLRLRATWAFIIAKFMTDPIWWFYLYWLPKFLNERHNLDLSKIAAPLVVIYTISSLGSIAGGWLSGHLIRSGRTVDKSRKIVFLICALCVLPIVDAAHVSDLWSAVALIGLAAAAHQGWSANLFTTVSDMFPPQDIASMTGIGGMAGSVGGMIFASGAGLILLKLTHGGYGWLFLISGCAYLGALAIFSLLVPRIEPIAIAPSGPIT